MKYTYEDFRGIDIDFTVAYDHCKGERRVMYDRDGGGYPGSPPTIDVTGVTVTAITTHGVTFKRDEMPFQFVDIIERIVFDRATDDPDLEAELFEQEAECEQSREF